MAVKLPVELFLLAFRGRRRCEVGRRGNLPRIFLESVANNPNLFSVSSRGKQFVQL